ncbi:MAG: Gldg family protein [Deltaproteobacteria bacterium]|nr:Gldg family protein [Deltaproteobacteria bacterium]
MRALYWVWRRELQVTLRAPIIYIVGGLFLAVQGIAFAGLVGVLSDPRKPAPLGALLEGQLAGTLLTWVLQLVVLTLLGMRTIADDKRGGAWELLLTAQVGEGAAVVGKWLAAVTVYALLWMPTLAYLGVVALFRADGGGWDVPSIACGYAGAIAMGAALLAWAVAASAATTTSLAAGALGFGLLIVIFLAGELPSVWPEAHVPAVLSVRAQLVTLSRGELALPAVVLVVALAVTGLSLAIALACAGRRRDTGRRVIATGIVAVIGALALAIATRHPASWDVSAARRNSLDPETRALVAALPAPATITIVEPTLGALAPIYDEVARVADRMAHAGPVRVTRVDPAALPGGIPAAARLAGVLPHDLASNGAVIVELAGKRRAVDLLQLADIDASGSIAQVAVERALTGTLAELAQAAPVTACFTTGHGELPVTHADKDADWSAVADRLRGAGISVELIDGAPPAHCDVVVVAGPAAPLSADDAIALQAVVARGGGLLVAAASRPINGSLAPTGLEGLLANEGIGITDAIAVDPSLAMRELPGALLVFDGYAAHPVNAGFERARPTLWYEPRALTVSGGAASLIRASAASWGERDRAHRPEQDPDDLAGPIVLAAVGSSAGGAPASGSAAGAHRVIALGSAESFATSLLAGGASAGDLWLAHAIRWLAGKPAPAVAVAARAPDQVKLVMTAGQRRAVIALCTAGIPLAWLLLGGALLLVRRRRA